jgi:hypothetical protein
MRVLEENSIARDGDGDQDTLIGYDEVGQDRQQVAAEDRQHQLEEWGRIEGEGEPAQPGQRGTLERRPLEGGTL